MSSKRVAYLSAAIAVLAYAAQAQAQVQAQAPASADGANTVGEIIVTATKRAELLRKVPASIAVVSAADLESKKIETIDDLARAVPNVSVSDSGGPGLGNVEIRGVSSQAGAATTALYIDDVPINILNLYTAGATEPHFFDMNRVEILRGPQGTLYGSSSMGGAIRFISNQPVFNQWGADVHAELSGTQGAGEPNGEASVVLNAPLVKDRVALRLGADYRQDGGWIDRVPPGGGSAIANDVNRNRTLVLRATLKAEVNDRLTITPAVFAQRYTATGSSLFNPALPRYQTDLRVPETSKDEFVAPSLTIRYDLGRADLTSITSYFARRYDRLVDGTLYDSAYIGSILDGLYGHGGDAIGALAAPSQFNTRDHRVTQEIRLASKDEGRLTWIAGLYYTHDSEQLIDVEYIPGFNATFQATYGTTPQNSLLASAFPNDLVFFARSVFDTNEYAAFGEVAYRFTSRLKATVGLRYDLADETLDFSTDGYLAGGPQKSVTASHSHSATPNFTLTYDVSPDVTAYSKIGQGYRLGGANRPVPATLCSADLGAQGLTAAPETYAPDDLWSYEAGIKGRTPDRAITFDAAVYDIEWSRLQEDVLLYDCGFDYKTNVGNARIDGAEVSANIRLGPNLRLDLGGNYTSAVVTTDEPALGVSRGDHVIGVPEYSVSSALEYSRPVDDRFEGYARADFQLVGPSQGAITHSDPDFHRPAYQVLGASIGLKDARMDVSLFATNLLDEAKIIQRPNVALITFGLRVPPRTIGVSANFHY
ncbi:MAG: TonB-dependent receptor [Caulobacteraceae bacterium]|nr:TonB-dependent receptor [Caulobacteraceae bacterium]